LVEQGLAKAEGIRTRRERVGNGGGAFGVEDTFLNAKGYYPGNFFMHERGKQTAQAMEAEADVNWRA
jgi:hypothetical protein